MVQRDPQGDQRAQQKEKEKEKERGINSLRT